MKDEILKMVDITKIYDNGIVANKNINFDIHLGEIHAIVGENGAGKSTLMKIIFGMEQPSSGEYYLYNKKVQIKNVEDAIQKGIGMVHQHFMLVESMNAVDNIMLGIEKKKNGFIDKKSSREVVECIAKQYNFKLDLDKPVSELSIGMKQKIEITKALVRGAKILIFDEPTAVLTPQETKELFVQLKKLALSGNTIIFISHKLNEVKDISDRITIIRNGETKGTYETENISLHEIASLMVGREIDTSIFLEKVETKEEILKIRNLTLKNKEKTLINNINFSVHSGEIVSLAGVEGNGQSEIVNIITKNILNYNGLIRIFGKDLSNQNVKQLRRNGLGYIPEDRMKKGVSQKENILDNIISTRYDEDKFSNKIFINLDNIEQYSNEVINEYKVKCNDNKNIIGYLSGGNIQKVVVGRECHNKPKILIAEQPTRGVDLGAASIIHEKLSELRKNGTAILLISADLNEIVKMSDRCLVLFEGEIAAEIKNIRETNMSELGEYMLGLKKMEVNSEQSY
ncbi:ABC transporter ATP-binding protein [Helcococcus kunzii]|uniref:ABC transporter ATP-binding protein n=1 Tax=Helcococcus kunzii TaxID=40091 RepID=UPI0024ADBA22|nr:ABC transporter ATP-binding protein [Helcococcus kunzii]